MSSSSGFVCGALPAAHTWIESACVRYIPFSHGFFSSLALWPNISMGAISCRSNAIIFLPWHRVAHKLERTFWKKYFGKWEKKRFAWMFQAVSRHKTFSATHTVILCIVGLCISSASPPHVCERSMSSVSSRGKTNARWLLVIIFNVHLTFGGLNCL